MNPYDAAFPRMSHTNCHGLRLEEQDGMTLRDYFAAKAMQGGIGLIPEMVRPKDGKTVPQIISDFAYEYADAMMEARK